MSKFEDFLVSDKCDYLINIMCILSTGFEFYRNMDGPHSWIFYFIIWLNGVLCAQLLWKAAIVDPTRKFLNSQISMLYGHIDQLNQRILNENKN